VNTIQTQMTQNELNIAIEDAFQFLASISMNLFDAWYEILHNEQIIDNIIYSEEIESEWNEFNLNLMLQGVMPPAQV
jgi:hypothetical protein